MGKRMGVTPVGVDLFLTSLVSAEAPIPTVT
jgi:hypothetical protein